VSDGRVLASSPNVRRLGALDLPEEPPGTTEVLAVERLPVRESGPYRVVAQGFESSSGSATVFVAVSIEDIDDTVSAATEVGVAGLPILVLALSAAMWVLIGRTLAPVEAIRSQADAITGRRLDRRVPEPARQDEIGRLARTVNAMLARLQDSADRQRRFVADAAHELRSPIASLRAQLETARDPRGCEAEEIRRDLLDETVRMQRLVDQLLLLARTDAGTVQPRRAAVDLDDTLDSVAAYCAANNGVRIDLSAVEPVQVLGDPDLLEQLVRNILDNAVRHAEREVRVTLSTADGQAVLTVDDDGPGIPAESRREIFHRFARLDRARDRDRGGVGLGLAIVADVARVHGGTVDAGDAPGGGARLRVRLPIDGPSRGPGPTAG